MDSIVSILAEFFRFACSYRQFQIVINDRTENKETVGQIKDMSFILCQCLTVPGQAKSYLLAQTKLNNKHLISIGLGRP